MYSVCSAVGWRSFERWLARATVRLLANLRRANKAVIPAVCVPPIAREQARVRAHPLEIGIQRADQRASSPPQNRHSPGRKSSSAPSDFGTLRPLRRDGRSARGVYYSRRCARFLPQTFRCDRVGCEHEDERMGSLDCPVDVFPCVPGGLPNPPGFLITTLQFLVQPG